MLKWIITLLCFVIQHPKSHPFFTPQNPLGSYNPSLCSYFNLAFYQTPSLRVHLWICLKQNSVIWISCFFVRAHFLYIYLLLCICRRVLCKCSSNSNIVTANFAIEGQNLNYSVTTKQGKLIPILKDCSLKIPTGQFWMLLGPNGCGKSTLLKVIPHFTIFLLKYLFKIWLTLTLVFLWS